MKRDEPLAVGNVRCSRCDKVVGTQVSERVNGVAQMRVTLTDPEHGLEAPIHCPGVDS
jgi:hypothetical protein